MTTLTGDIRFAFVQFNTDFLQALTFQNHLANLPLAISEVNTHQIPSLLALLIAFQLFYGAIQDILLLFITQPVLQIHSHILFILLQVGKHIQCLLLLILQNLGLTEFLGDNMIHII